MSYYYKNQQRKENMRRLAIACWVVAGVLAIAATAAYNQYDAESLANTIGVAAAVFAAGAVLSGVSALD